MSELPVLSGKQAIKVFLKLGFTNIFSLIPALILGP